MTDEATVQVLLDGLEDDRLSLAVEIASVPEHIRGFGHVKVGFVDAGLLKRTADVAQDAHHPSGRSRIQAVNASNVCRWPHG